MKTNMLRKLIFTHRLWTGNTKMFLSHNETQYAETGECERGWD